MVVARFATVKPENVKGHGKGNIVYTRRICGMNITVFLGSEFGNDEKIKEATRELGAWIAKGGHHLIYGGSESGLMGLVADSAMKNGGHVTGIEPKMFIELDYQKEDLEELIITEDMAERKSMMVELGDMFIALPGGTGTFEEIGEVMSRLALRQTDAPLVLYNIDGFYDELKVWLDRMIEKGFSNAERQKGIYFVSKLEEIKALAEKIKTGE